MSDEPIQEAAEPPVKDILVSKADLATMYLNGYAAGAEYALHLYAWWKDGTAYVGSTGTTWAKAKIDMAEHVESMRVAEGASS